MTQKELLELLNRSGLPVAYHHFKDAKKPPFIIFVCTGKDGIKADNRTYYSFRDYDIGLYTDKKDTALEKKIEALFDSAEIDYDCTESYIDSEKLFEVIYEITL